MIGVCVFRPRTPPRIPITPKNLFETFLFPLPARTAIFRAIRNRNPAKTPKDRFWELMMKCYPPNIPQPEQSAVFSTKKTLTFVRIYLASQKGISFCCDQFLQKRRIYAVLRLYKGDDKAMIALFRRNVPRALQRVRICYVTFF